MTNKEQLIEEQKQTIRASIEAFILAIACFVCGMIVYHDPFARNDSLLLYSSFLSAGGFLFVGIVLYGLWSYFQGYLKHMPENDPLPRKYWPSNVIPFRRRSESTPKVMD